VYNSIRAVVSSQVVSKRCRQDKKRACYYLQRFHEQNMGQKPSPACYDLKLKGLSNKTTLVLSNTRELDRVPSTE